MQPRGSPGASDGGSSYITRCLLYHALNYDTLSGIHDLPKEGL